MFIIIFSLIYFLYNIYINREKKLSKRELLPKICIYINNKNPGEIINNLIYQNYSKQLFDVYISTDENYKLKFKVYNYSRKKILSNNYDLICIISNIVDVNYLNFSAKSYMKGYDVIVSKSNETSIFLVKRIISRIFNNKIYDDNFSFNFEIFKSNVVNLKSSSLSRFVSSKSNNINYILSLKNQSECKIGKHFNVLDKPFILFKILLMLNIILISIVTNNFLSIIILTYLIMIIDNTLFLYRYHKIDYKTIFLLPISLCIYILHFFIYYIRSNV